MSNIKDDYKAYLDGVAGIEDENKRNDYINMCKFIMKKRALVKIIELSILALSAIGVIPSFLG